MKSEQLVVEIKGIGFPNKGAELMLEAICQAFAEHAPQAKLVMQPNNDYRFRSRYGLFQKLNTRKKGFNLAGFMGLIPRRLLDAYGIVFDHEINVIVDASGFAYGDQWGAEKARGRLGANIEALQAKGVKVFLLPQALGPFEDTALRVQMNTIFSHACRVYARDEQSLAYARAAAPHAPISQAYDFTNVVSGVPYASFDDAEHKVCIIPNAKMIEKTSLGNSYVDAMQAMLDYCLSIGAKPFLLVHEGKKDRAIAEQLAAHTGVPILEPVDPLKIKWVIGQSQLVISSRFHGLVSALSQGVPILATGWSHKYHHLLKEYNCLEAMVNVEQDLEAALKRIETMVTSSQAHESESQKLLDKSRQFKASVKAMWQDIFSTLLS